MMHDCSNVLGGRLLHPSVIKQVSLVCQEAKHNAGGYYEIIEKRADLALHTGVVIKHFPVEITKF